jgi:3-isopropylmalate dehydrogenase
MQNSRSGTGRSTASPRAARPAERLAAAIPGWERLPEPRAENVIGAFSGEGVGPEVVGAALDVLEAVADGSSLRFTVRHGGAIGLAARKALGAELTSEAASFCEGIFAEGGAVLCGPGGGRFVYELRAKFDLYCKLVPIRPVAALRDAGPLRERSVQGVDIVVVRESVGGAYFGDYGARRHSAGIEEAYHQFRYDAGQVERILRVAFELAVRRRGRLAVVVKPGGIPSISELWVQRAKQVNEAYGVELEALEVDNACYQIAADAARFDVVAAPNLFGDVVADTAALLLGSRGMSLSAGFGSAGRAVYQTGHGAAHDLAGSGRANPLGQIRSLAMLLGESFGHTDLQAAIELAVEEVLAAGWRTPDVMAPGCTCVGTRELARRVADAARAASREVRSGG